MAEQAKQYEEVYFRKSSQHANSNVAPDYDFSFEVNPNIESEYIPQEIPEQHLLTKFEWLFIGFSVVLTIALIACNLLIQSYNHNLEISANNYQNQTAELKQQTDIMINQIAEQYNYSSIKTAAEEQDMTVNKNQVKDVAE